MKRFKLLASTVIAALMFVPTIAMAQEEVTVLSEETTITFEEYENGATIAESLVNYKGLYLRYAAANHHLQSKTSNRSGIFSDGSEWDVSVAAYSQGTSIFNYLSEKPDWTPTSKIQDSSRDCIGFTTSCAGKVYVAIAPSKATAEEYMKIWFKGDSEDNYTEKVCQEATSKNPFMLEVETTEGGHFFVGATISSYIYAIRFVPSVITFGEFANGATIAESLVKYKGLCLRYDAEHKLQSKTSKRSGTFSDGTKWSVPVAAYSQSTNIFKYLPEKPDWAPTSKIQNSNRDCIGFTTSCAGKFYVAMAPSSANAGRYMKLWFKGNSDAGYSERVSQEATSTEPFVLETVVDEGGHFFVGATIACYIHAIRFVPATSLSIGSAGYATFCSKVNLNISGFADKFKAYSVSEINENSQVVMKRIKDVLPANTGVIVRGDAGAYNLLRTASSAAEITGNMLQAVTEETNVPSTTEGYQNYVLIQKNGNVGFYKVEEAGRIISAGKAYLQVPVTSGAKQMYGMVFEDETNGIVEMELHDNEGSLFYNLGGQRTEHPTKGLYISRGKKYIIK